MISLVKYNGKLSEYDLFLELEAFSRAEAATHGAALAHIPAERTDRRATSSGSGANARQVCVFGDFNGWDENAAPLESWRAASGRAFCPAEAL